MADEQVRIDVVADDHASKPIDAIAKKVDALEQPVEIPVEADTGQADRDVAGLMKKVDGLARDPATILLASNAASIAADITGLIGDLDKLDANDPEVQVKAEQINSLQGDLDTVEAKLRDLNGTPVDLNTKPAKQGLDEVGKSADSSKSVLANMVGNSTQDLGALGGMAGSVGVAMGQMGEYMADARAEGEGLGSILKSFGSVLGPIALIGVATKLIGDHFAKLDDDAKRADEQMTRFSRSIADGADDAAVLRRELEDTGKLDLRVQIEGPDLEVGDLTTAMANAGLNLEQFTALTKVSSAELAAWKKGAEEAGVSAGDLGTISLGLAAATQQLESAHANAANTAKVLGEHITTEREAVLAATLAQRDHVDAMTASADAARKAAKDQATLEQKTGATEQAARNLTAAWDELTGRLDAERAIKQIGDDFDAMREKGATAWDETRRHTKDAKAAQDEYADSVLAAKDDVVALGRQIGLSVPEVKSMLLQIDDGEIDDVERRLTILTRNRTMQLSIVQHGGSTGGGGYAGVGPSMAAPTPAPVEVVNVTQYLPRGWRGDALGEMRRTARRSGGLYRRVRR